MIGAGAPAAGAPGFATLVGFPVASLPVPGLAPNLGVPLTIADVRCVPLTTGLAFVAVLVGLVIFAAGFAASLGGCFAVTLAAVFTITRAALGADFIGFAACRV